MVSAPQLCSGVHGWLDHLRLCTIDEECGVSNTKENSSGTDLRSPSHKKCVNVSHMQVDPLQMHVGDKGKVGREGSGPLDSKNMVGNPLSQPLAPERAPDRALSCKPSPTEDLNNHVSVKGSHLKHYLEAPLTYPCGGIPLSAPIPRNSVVSEEAGASKHAENVEVFPTQQRPGGERDSQEVRLNSNLAHPAEKTHTQTRSRSLSSSRCSQLKTGQPIAFLLQPNLSCQLGSRTLPSNLDQITVLRKIPATKLSAECHLKGSSRDMAAELLPCPQHLTAGRASAPETKLSFKALKPKCCSASTKKNVIAGKDENLAEDAEPRLDAPAPLKQSAPGSACLVPLSLTQSSETCCGSAEAHFIAQNRVLNEKDKCSLNHSDKNTSSPSTSLESPCGTEEHTEASPGEVKDIPLDLSPKSKRQKNTKQVQKILQAGSHLESEPNDTISNEEVLQTPASSSVPSVPYAFLSDTMANGALPKNSFTQLNHPVLEPSASWAKIQIQNTKGPVSLLGTYVGIANPVLASTLRTKDGKGIAFVEDIQDLGRPETISIIDQGEQLLSSRKKGSSSRTRDSRQRHYKFPSNTQEAGLQQCQSTQASSKVILSTVSPQVGVKGKLSGGKQTVSLSPKSKQLLPVRHLGASSQSPLKKVGMSSSFKLETVVEGGSLETSSNINKGCGNQAATELGRTEGTVLAAGHRDDLVQHSAKCTSVTNEGKRDGRQDNCQAVRMPTGLIRNIAESVYNTTEKHQDENPETRDSSDKSRQTIRLQMSGDLSRIGRGKKDLIQVSGEREKNGLQLVQGLSADSKVDGVAVSVLNGQCSGRNMSRTNGVSQTSSSEKVVVINKNKKCRMSKQDKAQKEASRKTTMGFGDHKMKIPVITRKKQTKKVSLQKNQLAPGLEPKLPEAKGGKRRQGGRCSVTVAEALLHLEAGNVSNLPVLRETAGDTKLELSGVISGGATAPRPRRGRRRTAKVEAGGHSLASRSATPSHSSVRRPRGRPRSNGPSNQAKWDAETAMRRSQRDTEARKKRKRCRNRRYQNEEYIMERDKSHGQVTSKKSVSARRAARGTAAPMTATPPCQSDGPSGCPKRPLLTRSGSSKCQDICSTPKLADKPSGKRKFKTKHSGGKEEGGRMLKTKRGCLGKRPAPPVVYSGTPPAKRLSSMSSPTPNWRGGVEKARILESPPGRVIPPEVRRLIVNKNAGETLLQRASRLGYEEVVLYCLEKDPQELNRRDNAGYTALHKACARGWAQIVLVLLDHGADVNCGAQDGTRPIHDAVVNDNLSIVWMLLNHGADPTLATYSGQTALKLAQSTSMQSFLMEYFADQEGRPEQDPRLRWDFYSSVLFETEEKACWDFLLSVPEGDEGDRGNGGEAEEAEAGDCLLFELSDEPHIPCYHIQVSLFQGYCNWFLLTDVLRRLKTSARLFQARYPHFHVVGVPCSELQRQASASQLTLLPGNLQPAKDLDDSLVQLVKCVPDLQRLLGSTVHCLTREASTESASPCGR